MLYDGDAPNNGYSAQTALFYSATYGKNNCSLLVSSAAGGFFAVVDATGAVLFQRPPPPPPPPSTPPCTQLPCTCTSAPPPTTMTPPSSTPSSGVPLHCAGCALRCAQVERGIVLEHCWSPAILLHQRAEMFLVLSLTSVVMLNLTLL